MKILYLILAHTQPQQLSRMLLRLEHPDVSFYVHIDRQVAIQPFVDVVQEAKISNVIWAKRRSEIPWGSYGMTEAIFSAFSDLVKNNIPFNYLVCISGMDYPLRPYTGIADYLSKAGGQPIIRATPIAELTHWGENRYYRLETYFYWHPLSKEIRTFPPDEPPHTFKGKILQWYLEKRFPLPKPILPQFNVYGGSSWWALTPEVIQFLLGQYSSHSAYKKLFRYCSGAEEMIFHTILGNHPEWYERLDRRLTHYQHWSTTKHPDILTVKFCDRLKEASEVFPLARKFDERVDSGVLDWIDQELLGI